MAGWVGGSSTLGSVGQHSIETTEINRGGEWAGVLVPGPVPLGTRTRPLPAHLPHPPTPLTGLPNAAALTQSTRPADWLEGKNYNVGVGVGGEARSRAVSQGWSRPQYSSWSSCWCSSISSSSGGANPSWRGQGRGIVSQAGQAEVSGLTWGCRRWG